MKFIYSDGGRSNYFKAEHVGDCCVRAIANATGLDYKVVYDGINALAKKERTGKRKRKVSNAREGVYKTTANKYLESIGWVWKPCMSIGTGCQVHLTEDELPSGNLILNLSRHFTCVKDGVLYDTYDCSRDGNRCVYGYWYKPINLDDEWKEKKFMRENQKFAEGDVAILNSNGNEWKVKVVLPIQEEDGSWWYEVECVDPRVSENIRKNYHREVAQNRLSRR